MIEKYFKIVALLLLVGILVQGFFMPLEGISPEEELYRLEIHDLNQDKVIKNKMIDSLLNTNKIYENFYDSLENDNSIDTARSKQLKLNLSNYAKSRR